MSVIVVGLEQRQSPLELLERVAVPESALPKALGRLRDQSNLSEAVILSTCLRTEVYAVVERFHDGVAELQEFLATISGCPVDVLADHLTVRFDDDVTHHLFAVMTRRADHRLDTLPQTELMQRWWAMMGDIMETNPDASPVQVPLKEMFALTA